MITAYPIEPEAFLSAFRKALTANPESWKLYGNKRPWTLGVTAALVSACRAVFSDIEGVTAVAKGHRSAHGRSEFMTFDVLAYVQPLGKIFAAVEHENVPDKRVVRYQVWKLMSLRAEHRILVAYWRRSRAGSNAPGSSEDLERCVEDAAARCGGGPLWLLSADADYRPKTCPELAGAFSIRSVPPPTGEHVRQR